jgi:hypothetical protein
MKIMVGGSIFILILSRKGKININLD